jgi:hypothetical protein
MNTDGGFRIYWVPSAWAVKLQKPWRWKRAWYMVRLG